MENIDESLEELILKEDDEIVQIHIGEVFINVSVSEANNLIEEMKVCIPEYIVIFYTQII